jgi:hypothetical protein
MTDRTLQRSKKREKRGAERQRQREGTEGRKNKTIVAGKDV